MEVMEVKMNRQLALLIVIVAAFFVLMRRLLLAERECQLLRAEYNELLEALSSSKGIPAHSFDDGWCQHVATLCMATGGES